MIHVQQTSMQERSIVSITHYGRRSCHYQPITLLVQKQRFQPIAWLTQGNITSGSASAVKEPGHFEVRKSSSQVTRMHFFSSKKLTTFFSRRPQNTGRQRRFTVKIKQIKRLDMVTFLFSVHTITEAKQYAGLGRAQPGLEPGRWIFQPGHLNRCALV